MPEPITNKALKRLRDLHAMLGSPGERDNAWRKIDAWLAKYGKTWNDVAELLHDPSVAAQRAYHDPRDATAAQTAAQQAASTGTAITPLDLIRHLLEQYVWLEPHECVAVALWIVHTHVFDQFMVTPRLALMSPVPNCGKTTVLDLIACMSARAEKSDNITAAAIYHAVDEERRTLLADEFDNLEIAVKGTLRSVFNSGYRRGGSVTRLFRGRRRRFNTFAPLALASIGGLPLPLMSRSLAIKMVRYTGAQNLRRFDANDTDDLNIVYAHTLMWSREVRLNWDPPMPEQLRGRLADNWRPLIAIADACGPAWGAEARAAALVFARSYHNDDDLGVLLLHDIRAIFDARGVDRLFSKILVEALRAMDDAPWSEWRGVHDNQTPRPLSQAQLAAILKWFDIRPRSIWPLREASNRSATGYYRSMFESAWRAYCDGEAGRSAEPTPINRLNRG